jgi:uncharacterized protein (DUF1501 family)
MAREEMTMCISMNRRSFLASLAAATALPLFGGGAARADGTARRAKSCILLWANGGPSHLDTWDPKKGAVAGPLAPRATNVAGVSIAQHLPQLAQRCDRLAIVRGMTSKEGSHERAQSLGHTGHVPNPTVAAPAFGAWVARERGPAAGSAGALPPFVALGGVTTGAGFLGRGFDPFVVASPGSMPDNLTASRPVSAERSRRREDLLRDLDGDFAKRVGQPAVAARSAVHGRAVALAGAKEAQLFDLASEPTADVARYGDSGFGRGCLVARRLVEAGVPFVEVVQDGWDTHQDHFARIEKLSAALDPAMSALLDDIRDRHLDTVVLWMGEFGRTPRISADEGRDHHPAAFSAVLAGAGIRGGVVHGETGADGARVVKEPTSVADLHATVATAMGLDPNLTRMTPEGRPFSMVDGGRAIRSVLTS